MKKIKKFKMPYIIIFISVILIIAGVFFSFLENKEDKEKKGNNPSDKASLNISEEELNKYINYIPIITNNDYNIFQDKFIDVRDVPVQLVANHYYSILNEMDVVGCGIDLPENECVEKDGTYLNNVCYLEGYTSTDNYYFKKDTFSNNIKKHYSIDDVDVDNITNEDNCSCSLNGDTFYCLCKSSTVGIGYFKNLIMYYGHEFIGDELFITIKYLYAKYTDEDESGNMYVELYDNVNGNEVGFVHTFDSEGAFNKYGEKASLYKNTFKKNPDGSYYWYSIEPVKEEIEAK